MTRPLDSNLRLIDRHAILAGSLVWLPTMILYTRAEFGLGRAVTLSALYYLFVVVLEVPSGWASDTFGRVNTLRVAAISWMVAHGLFVLGQGSFPAFVAGEAMLAAGFACLSGTDVSFHFDTLEGLGRAQAYQARQARLASRTYVATALAALTGGALGYIDLRLPLVVAFILAGIQLASTFPMIEPAIRTERDGTLGGLVRQVAHCLTYLRSPLVGWLFFYGITMVVLEHVAFTYMQPWLTEAGGYNAEAVGTTPLLSGVVVAVVASVGAAAARLVDPAANRFGVVPVLIGLGALSAVIVTSMAATFSLIVVGLLVFRSVQGAAAPVLLSSTLAPRLRIDHRATFISLNSLAGRLLWGLILLVVASSTGDDLPAGLTTLSTVALTLVAVLVVSWLMVRPRIVDDTPTGSEEESPVEEAG